MFFVLSPVILIMIRDAHLLGSGSAGTGRHAAEIAVKAAAAVENFMAAVVVVVVVVVQQWQ